VSTSSVVVQAADGLAGGEHRQIIEEILRSPSRHD
jgi:hypothetical protein